MYISKLFYLLICISGIYCKPFDSTAEDNNIIDSDKSEYESTSRMCNNLFGSQIENSNYASFGLSKFLCEVIVISATEDDEKKIVKRDTRPRITNAQRIYNRFKKANEKNTIYDQTRSVLTIISAIFPL